MDRSHDESVSTDRRRYLVALGGAVATAGCSSLLGGSSGSGPGDSADAESATPVPTTVEGPARFVPSIDAPAEATVDTEIPVTLTVRNVGGEGGEFAGSLRSIEGAQSVRREALVEDVPPGETGSTALTVSFSRADEYVLRVGGRGGEATAELSVGPVAGGVGEPLELRGGLRVTLTDVSHEVGLFYASGRSDGADAYYSPGGDQSLAVCRFEVENTGTEPRPFGGLLSPSAGSILASYPHGQLETTTGVDGRPLSGQITVAPGQRVRRWVPVQVPRSAVSSGYAVEWQRDAAETPPERRWTVEGRPLPSFTLAEWTLPQEASPGQTTYAITVRNDGEADGTVRGSVDARDPDAADWTTMQLFERDIPAGESATVEFSDEWRYTAAREYRVRPMATRRTVEYVAPTLSVGESLAVPFGRVTATAAERATEAAIAFEDRTVTPNNGAFVLVAVEYANEVAGETRLPDPNNSFTLRAGDEEYERRNINFGFGGNPEEFTAPLAGRELDYERMVYNGPYGQGDTKRGIALFDVPESVSLSDATLVFDHDNSARPVEATWRLE